VCALCNNVHQLYKCRKFREATQQQRVDIVRRHQLCYNCLTSGHTTNSCPSEHRCRQCGKGHYTLIHGHESEARPLLGQPSNSLQRVRQDSPQGLTQENVVATYCSLKAKPQTRVLLTTAQVIVCNNLGQPHKCKALLDSAS
jgi:hypothetical protein